MDNIALLILGIFISVIGIVNMTGNISTIHSYNRRKVKEEDVPKYGRAVGTGTLIIGVSLIAAFVTTFWSEKAMVYLCLVIRDHRKKQRKALYNAVLKSKMRSHRTPL